MLPKSTADGSGPLLAVAVPLLGGYVAEPQGHPPARDLEEQGRGQVNMIGLNVLWVL